MTGCVQFAAPPPLITAGGPDTTPPHVSEVAIGIGTGLALFDDAHAGGNAWLGRWRHGISQRLDLGVDAMGANHGDTGTFNFKAAVRYKLSDRTRIETGLGAADNSDGKSLSTELALTVGPSRRNRFWNRYASLRIAWARGYPENALSLAPDDNDNTPPNTGFGLINLGVTARVSSVQKLFMELGLGFIDPRREEPGPMVFWGIGMLYDIGEPTSEHADGYRLSEASESTRGDAQYASVRAHP